MRIIKLISGFFGLVMLVIGSVWMLQGLDLLRGGAMGGVMAWAYRGAALAILGGGLLYWVARTSGPLRAVVGLVGSVMLLVGFIWILQGVNVLPGSFMTGVIAWAYRGAALAVVGGAVTFWATRRSGAGKDIVGGLGALFILVGIVWILQGAGIVPVGLMAGVFAWVYRGTLLAGIGAGLMFWGIRPGPGTP